MPEDDDFSLMPQQIARNKTDINPVVVDVTCFHFTVHINNSLPSINLKFSSDYCGFQLVYGNVSYKTYWNLNSNIRQLPLIATVSTDRPSIDSKRDRQCTYNVTMALSHTNCYRGKAIMLNIMLVCLYLSHYPVWKPHAPYYEGRTESHEQQFFVK